MRLRTNDKRVRCVNRIIKLFFPGYVKMKCVPVLIYLLIYSIVDIKKKLTIKVALKLCLNLFRHNFVTRSFAHNGRSVLIRRFFYDWVLFLHSRHLPEFIVFASHFISRDKPPKIWKMMAVKSWISLFCAIKGVSCDLVDISTHSYFPFRTKRWTIALVKRVKTTVVANPSVPM